MGGEDDLDMFTLLIFQIIIKKCAHSAAKMF